MKSKVSKEESSTSRGKSTAPKNNTYNTLKYVDFIGMEQDNQMGVRDHTNSYNEDKYYSKFNGKNPQDFSPEEWLSSPRYNFDDIIGPQFELPVRGQPLKKIQRPSEVMTKLKISTPGEKQEQEADAVADQVMRMKDSDIQRQSLGKEDEEEISAKKKNEEKTEIHPETEEKIQNLGSGKPLSESERKFFEPRFGKDFSDVKIHTGSEAAELAEDINARAFTRGKDIVFGEGEYNTSSYDGKRLMAHELDHTVQKGIDKSNNISKKGKSNKEETSIYKSYQKDLDTIVKALKRIEKKVKNKRIKFRHKDIVLPHILKINQSLRIYLNHADELYNNIPKETKKEMEAGLPKYSPLLPYLTKMLAESKQAVPPKAKGKGGIELGLILLLMASYSTNEAVRAHIKAAEYKTLENEWQEIVGECEALNNALDRIEESEEDECSPVPLGYHRGGDAYHNYCADKIPPNQFQGSDVLVKGKAFDALGLNKTLWEIKTARLSTYNQFLKEIEVKNTIYGSKTSEGAIMENRYAKECGFHFILGVIDKEYYNRLIKDPKVIEERIDVRYFEGY